VCVLIRFVSTRLDTFFSEVTIVSTDQRQSPKFHSSIVTSSHFFFDFFSKNKKKTISVKTFFSLSRMKNRRFNNRNKRKKLLAKNVNA